MPDIIANMHYGVDYYPEHWESERWPVDLDLMVRARLDLVRVAEFAWSRLEPREGGYDFGWLDHFIELAADRGISVMLGVPARNVPAWLFAKDPQVAILAADGHREAFGTRYTTCLNNETLRHHAFALAEHMAERYANSAAVSSWHLDNELGDASLCYCPTCRSRFIDWLKGRYSGVEALNAAWGLAFWSLEIGRWEEIQLPARTNHFPHNPALLLDFRRFSSATTVEFAREQVRAIRAAGSEKTITTNLQSMTRFHTDYFALGETIDIASTNYYPPENYRSMDLDLVRGVKGTGFWVVEQKSGAPDLKVRLPSRTLVHNGTLVPQPGETRAFAYQSVSRGAEMMLYFRWRPCLFGAEQLHGGVLGYDGRPGRIYEEVRQTGEELARIAPRIDGTTVRSEVALLYSYDSRWALEAYSPGPQMEYRATFLAWHEGLESRHVAVDIIPPHRGLSGYRLVIAPLLYVMDDSAAQALVSYAEAGGTLVLTARSGAKDAKANIAPIGFPPALAEALGSRIGESFALAPEDSTSIELEDGREYRSGSWVDLIGSGDARVVARYAAGWYRGSAAIVARNVGEGEIYYLGTVPCEEFRERFLGDLLHELGIEAELQASRHIQVMRRTNDEGEAVLIVVNPTQRPGQVYLDALFRDLLSDREYFGVVELPPWGVMVLAKS